VDVSLFPEGWCSSVQLYTQRHTADDYNFICLLPPGWTEIATGWMVRTSNPGRNKIFTHPFRRAHPASFTMGTGGKTAGAWYSPPTPSIATVEDRVELYLYSPSGPSWPVNFTFTFRQDLKFETSCTLEISRSRDAVCEDVV
jgi:hypothetical protein